MSEGGAGVVRQSSSMRSLIEEATAALARLDAERLAELALSCEALNREMPRAGAGESPGEVDARGAANAMRVFSRVLDATRANVAFLRRLGEPASERLEYRPECNWAAGGGDRGNH